MGTQHTPTRLINYFTLGFLILKDREKMKLTKIALITAAVNAQDGSGDDYATDSSVNDEAPVQLEHRSLFGNSPFAAIFASLDKPKKEKKQKNDAQVANTTEDYDDEESDEYEGDLEGFDIEQFRESDTVNRVEVLMKMIMYLQVDPSFDKFFQYGCYCFP